MVIDDPSERRRLSLDAGSYIEYCLERFYPLSRVRSSPWPKAFITYSTTVILQAVANGYRYGFDIIDITGMPGGTVYPALRRLEEAGHLSSKWEKPSVARPNRARRGSTTS